MKSTSILESHKNAQENVCAGHILMIDDDEMMRILFRDTFWIHTPSHQPIDVATVRSIPDAKAYLKETKSRPDVIFMGLWLLVENSDGSSTREADPSIEFIQQLRKDSAYKKTPIVVYSRYSDPACKERAIEAGASYYLVKGELSPREMVDFVGKLKAYECDY